MVPSAVKTRISVVILAIGFAGEVVCLAQNAQVGTWRLNEARSKLSPSGPKDTKIVYETVGDAVRVTVDGVERDGKRTHNEWIGKFNGRDYPVTGDPNSDMRSYTRIDDRTLGLNIRKGGDDIISGRIQISPNGKTCTVTVRGADPTGKKFRSVSVYDRQ